MGSETTHCSRRKFLSRATAGFASVGIVGVSGAKLPAFLPDNARQSRTIIHRTLGRTGLTVPIVSMGVMNANNPEIIKQSYEAGVRLFDTAHSYQGGRNEEMVGRVIKELGVRDRVIIQTKIAVPSGGRRRGGSASQMSYEQKKDAFLKDFDLSMKRLQMDYVDILMIHQPSVQQMNDPALKDALSQAKKEKRARFLGVSTHARQADVLNSAAETGFYDVVLTSINCAMADDKKLLEAIANAASKNVGVIAMKTQLKGRRYNDWGPINHTAVLKWVMRHEAVTTSIPGYTNFDQMKESFSVAYGIDYTPEEEKYLKDNSVSFAAEFCRQCGECRDTCARGVDIPALMRTHMYAACYSNFYQARATLEEIPDEMGLKNCASCASCTANCVNDIAIAAHIGELKMMYA